MSTREILESIWRGANTTLFTVGETPVTVSTILTVLLVLVATFWISRILQRGVRRVLAMRGVKDEGTLSVLSRLLHYLLVVIGIGIALQTVGIQLGALFAAGALFAVGIGFAMQNIAQNFFSGIILMVERSIKPGDVLEVEGRVVRVIQMGIRAALVRTRDEEDLIVPNSVIVQGSVKNYTLRDSIYRVRVTVGVIYGSDMALVEATLAAAADKIEGRLSKPPPQVLWVGFGSSSVDFEVSVWTEDPWQSRQLTSRSYRSIWSSFQEAGITIAFPQLDVHFDPPVMEALGRRAA